MPVSAFTFTDPGYLAVRKGTIDLENDTLWWVLVDNAQTPNKATDNLYSVISANECTDGDYAPEPAASVAWTNPTGRQFKLDAADVDFGDAVTISARYAYLVRVANGTSLQAGDLIVGYYDLNDGGAANVSSSASHFDIQHHATNGLFLDTITPA